jgi:hypothetical protein
MLRYARARHLLCDERTHGGSMTTTLPSAAPGASSTGEPTITSTAIIRSPVTHKSEMRSILTFNSKSPAPGPGFQGEVRKQHLSMPPLKRGATSPVGPSSTAYGGGRGSRPGRCASQTIVWSAIRALTHVNCDGAQSDALQGRCSNQDRLWLLPKSLASDSRHDQAARGTCRSPVIEASRFDGVGIRRLYDASAFPLARRDASLPL